MPCTVRHIKGLMEEAGLRIREDVMGNIFGRWQGSNASAGAPQTPSARPCRHPLKTKETAEPHNPAVPGAHITVCIPDSTIKQGLHRGMRG